MRGYKKSRHYFSFLFLIIIIAGIGVGGWYLFMKEPNVDTKTIETVFEQDQDYQYFYQKLSQEDQKIYQRIYYVLHEHQEMVPIQEENIDKITDVFEKVLYDHPEFYYVNGQFRYILNQETVNFIPEYDYSQAEVGKWDQQIRDHTEKTIKEAQQISDPVEKAKFLYRYIVENVKYQENKKTDQNILSSLVQKKSVCAGYARAYQYLANRAGLETVYIVGVAKEDNLQTASGDGHAWVMLHLDDDYYYCDPTWGDVVDKDAKHTCYGYFMMNSQDMLACYQPDVSYEKTKKQTINLFKDQNCYMENYDEKILSRAVQQGLQNKTRVAEIKCGNEQVYQQVKSKLDSSYLGYHLLNNNNCWSSKATYYCNDKLRLIELYY